MGERVRELWPCRVTSVTTLVCVTFLLLFLTRQNQQMLSVANVTI